MSCAKCGTENPTGAAFCMACGSPLSLACPSCATALPGGARFCFSCGTEIGSPAPVEPAAPSPEAPLDQDESLTRYIPSELLSKLEFAASSGGMQGERRKVTMLFCDVEGSTAAAEQLDPEEWADIMNGAFEHLIAPVYRYEGTLARLMGDAILAFFGAPIGHEDDPERAVLAALGIIEEIEPYRAEVRDQWGIDLDVRIGINTGLVVVGAVGSDLRVEYTAMGDAVNLAARMEQSAEAGTIQITEDTKALVEKLFDVVRLGAIDVKGKSQPVQTYRVVRVLERPENLRGVEGLSSPLIGRSDELDRLVGAVHEVMRSGQGRVISVIGEAGLGKTRLVAELQDRLATEAAAPGWHVGRSLSYEKTTPYTSARRVLRSLLGLTGEESDAEAWRRIVASVMQATPGRSAEIAPFLAWLLEVPVDDEYAHRISYLQPPQLRAEAFRAALELIEAVSSQRQTAIVFEDLHWADDASIELVEAMLEIVDRSMLAIILLFRPRRDEPAWRVHQLAEQQYPHLYVPVTLSPLNDTATRELVASLLAVDGLTDEVRKRILERADGNPFFVEEIIRTMIDAGVVRHDGSRWVATQDAGAFEVPENLRAVLTTRLDRLDEPTRSIAQAASVVGRRFRYDELAAATADVSGLDTGLAELQRRELITEVTRIPKRMYAFRHALLQEATYATVLLKQRTQLHSSVAEFLIAISPERVSDIADHLVAGRQSARAIPFLVAAGEAAAGAYALDAAAARFDQALDLIDDETDSALLRRSLEGRGKIDEYRFDLTAAADIYQQLIDEGERRGDVRMQVSGINKRSLIRGFFFDEREAALEQLGASEQLARDLDLGDGLVEACISQCYLRTAYAEFDEVEHYMKEVTALGIETGAEEPTLFGMTHYANTLLFLTRFDEALLESEAALARAEELGNLHYQAELLTFAIPICHMRNGDVEAANASVERGMEIAQRIGDRASEAVAGVFQGKAAMARGHVEDAVALFRRAVAAADATGLPSYRAMSMCATGTCQLQIGGPLLERALALHNETLDVMELPTGKGLGAWLWSEIAYCAMAAGHLDDAQGLFDRALNEQTMMMHLARPVALLGKAELALKYGRIEEARVFHAEAAAYVEQHDMWDQRAEIGYVAGVVDAAGGDHTAALERFAACEQLLLESGMRRRLIELEAARARSLDVLGRSEEAAAARAAGKAIATEIETSIHDGELRAAFLQGSSEMLGLSTA